MSINRGGKRGYPPEFRAQAVELYRSSGLSFARVADDLGVSIASLKAWVKQAEIDAGEREGLVSAEREELVALRRETGCCVKSVKY
jgi:transposase